MALENTCVSTATYFAGMQHNSIRKKILLPIHENIVEKLDKFLETSKVPHLLFHGTSGSGKRTIVNMFINKIYNNDKYRIRQNVMQVNCSHGKGIKFIREDLKFFAKTNIQSDKGTNFKTIVLLNAEHLTIDAQSALRRCIELFSYNTRFFIIVENKHKLLNPILSRFCEIYIPEYVENGEIVNLHSKSKRENYDISVFNRSQLWITSKLAELDIDTITHSDLIQVSNQMHDKGYSCLDLINWINQSDNMNDNEKSTITLYFEKIKAEYRSEPMLIFTILDFTYLRKDKDICF
jgi:replication-associated recombination protein RarA